MTGFVAMLLSLALQLVAFATKPTHARCPHGWRLDGVNRDGAFTCDRPTRGSWQDEEVVLISVQSKVYCTGGSEPINVNGVDVSCQARH